MAMTIHVDIVSTSREIFSGPVTLVTATGELGELGILPRHSQLLTRLKPGPVKLRMLNGEEEIFYVSGGLMEVQPHVVTILADTAENAGNLDEAAALEAKRHAEQLMADKRGDYEYARAEADLAEAIAQLRTIEKLRKNRH